MNRRALEDKVAAWVVRLCGALAVAILVGIFGLLLVNALRTFGGGIELQPLTDAEVAALPAADVAELQSVEQQPPTPASMLGGATWRPDAYGKASYGVGAMVLGTLLTTVGAMLLAVPVGLAAAAWLAFRAEGVWRDAVKFGIEMLAAIPSVVIGFIGIQVVAPLIQELFGVSGLNALNGAILLGIMALPTIVSLAEDALSSVPREWIDGSLALGADRWQTMARVAFPAAQSGLFAACMLGMGRAIGETMTVLMATGNTVAVPGSFFDPVRTMTATIAIELGEVPQGTTHYYALFAVGLLLFLVTLGIQVAADMVQRRQERFH